MTQEMLTMAAPRATALAQKALVQKALARKALAREALARGALELVLKTAPSQWQSSIEWWW